MSGNELTATIKELRELKRMREDLQAEIDQTEDTLKAYMTSTDQDTIQTAEYRVTWKEVTSSRLDTAAIKAALPDLADRFTKITTTRRLIVA